MAKKVQKDDPVATAWKQVEARLAKSSLASPLADASELEGAFEYVFEFGLPSAVWTSYERHDGERGKPSVCPPLRLVSAQEALSFAAALVGQGDPTPAVTAYRKLAPRYEKSMSKQGLRSSSSDAARWTLALGDAGHRIAVDCEAEWVIEERPDGSVVKLADDFVAWLGALARSEAETPPAATPKKTKPIDKTHAAFLAALGPPITYRAVDAKETARIGKVHPWLGKLVARDGVASYGEQLVWTCAPGDFEDLAAVWKKHGTWLKRFETTPGAGNVQPGLDAEVIARSAFGHVFLLTRKHGMWRADPEDGVVRSEGIVARDGTAFVPGVFEGLADRADTAVRLGSPTELRAAAKKHGALDWNQAYFWNKKKSFHSECVKRELLEGTRLALGVKR